MTFDLNEAAQTILKPHWPVVRNMEENEARQREVKRIIGIIAATQEPAGSAASDEQSPDKTKEIEWGRESVYTHLQGNVGDENGCYGCPVEEAVAAALEKRTVFTDPIGRALLMVAERLPGSPRKVGEDGASERIWCMECGKSVSTPVPRDTIVRAWVQCPECIEKGKGL